jgi:glucokinase
MDSIESRSIVAIDLGGTKIAAALVTPSGKILHRDRVPTMASEGPKRVIERLCALIASVLKDTSLTSSNLGAISVAAAGVIDMANGLVSASPNLPGWNSVPLCRITGERFGVPSYLINDAKAAAVGEHEFGAGMGTNNLIVLTLGTGIGGGIIAGGRLYLGQSGAAGEVGHMTIDVSGPKCPCGNTGCWELYASGTAMEREASNRLSVGTASSLNAVLRSSGNVVTARQIEAAARQGDRLALEIMAWSSKNIGVGLANLVNIFNPEMIVTGGGLSNIGDLLIKPAIDTMRARSFALPANTVRVVASTMGEDAGMLGAAAFAFRQGRL